MRWSKGSDGSEGRSFAAPRLRFLALFTHGLRGGLSPFATSRLNPRSESTAPTAQRISTILPLISAFLLLAISTFLLRGAAGEKRLSIYSKVANYSLPVAEHGGQDYVGLFETLEPLGTVTAKTDGAKWRLRYNSVDSEFSNGKKRAKVKGHEFDLPANFVLENGRGWVPVSSLSTVLPQFLGGPVTFHESSRRLFVGDVGVHFTAQINKAAALVMNFSSPVNPSISTEPGRLHMVFSREPLVAPGSQTLTFNDSAIPSAAYLEENGAAEIDVRGTVPLFASFSNDGKTITIAPAAQAAATAQAAGTAAAGAMATAPAPAAPVAPGPHRYFAVVDASHGGDERGAALTDQLAEKDVTLAFARRLRYEMDARGMNTLLVRDGDATMTLDQRANITNTTRPVIYICLHATSQGNGVRLYTALVPQVGESRGPFLEWDTAQSPFLNNSVGAEASLSAEFGRRQIAVRTLVAPLRPLNNIIAPAIAVEVAPSADGISSLTAPGYQQLVASSIASAVAVARDKLGASR
ncbi:MAG TPA: N-acetylmuramoyl-L-alanine amidase [Terriglobales bacterium]|nr:N-acetylmuramoyl-L-alanine amidase [Terriglobales bacterium]